MSNFFIKVRNKETGEMVEVIALDDYFGGNQYGYIIDGSNMSDAEPQDVFFNKYERMEDTNDNR